MGFQGVFIRAEMVKRYPSTNNLPSFHFRCIPRGLQAGQNASDSLKREITGKNVGVGQPTVHRPADYPLTNKSIYSPSSRVHLRMKCQKTGKWISDTLHLLLNKALHITVTKLQLYQYITTSLIFSYYRTRPLVSCVTSLTDFLLSHLSE